MRISKSRYFEFIIKYIALILTPLLLFAEVCYFTPPQDWQLAEPKGLSEYIQIVCIGQGDHALRPTLNLAIEELESSSMKEYLKAVKEIHEQEMHMIWKDLGAFQFRSGKGRLSEITNHTPMGEIKMLQGILIKNSRAYILTGSVIKEEFANLRSILIAALRSLTVAPDLYSSLEVPKKERLQALLHEESAKQLQAILDKEYAEQGRYWSYLIQKENQALKESGL